jgi:5-hydroxyisourate hydrolase-like protein (transthyretin family)
MIVVMMLSGDLDLRLACPHLSLTVYNARMLRRSFFRLSLFVAVFGLVVPMLSANAQETNKRGRKFKSPPPTARIEVTVLRRIDGKPIRNAAVIFHAIEGEKDKGYMELKTNEDGKSVIDVMPIGDTVRLQIIAKGFQTYGQDYKIDKASLAIEIQMKRPGEQYSIYENHSAAADPGATPGKDKPSDSAKQPDAQPSQPQPK